MTKYLAAVGFNNRKPVTCKALKLPVSLFKLKQLLLKIRTEAVRVVKLDSLRDLSMLMHNLDLVFSFDFFAAFSLKKMLLCAECSKDCFSLPSIFRCDNRCLYHFGGIEVYSLCLCNAGIFIRLMDHCPVFISNQDLKQIMIDESAITIEKIVEDAANRYYSAESCCSVEIPRIADSRIDRMLRDVRSKRLEVAYKSYGRFELFVERTSTEATKIITSMKLCRDSICLVSCRQKDFFCTITILGRNPRIFICILDCCLFVSYRDERKKCEIFEFRRLEDLTLLHLDLIHQYFNLASRFDLCKGKFLSLFDFLRSKV